jgi:uncharacterized protein YgiM (DUF1202 family)
MKYVLWVSLFLFCALAQAETGYVSDNLRVGVRPEPENIAPVGVVTSGMKLEILDRDGAYIHIRSENGQQGWIKDIYVVSKPPAIIRLQQLRLEEKGLQAKLSSLEENNNVLQQANNSLSKQIEVLEERQNQYRNEQVKQQMNNLPPDETTHLSWLWWMLAVIVLAGAGFLSGINWYRQHVMKRLGGLRV